MSHDQKISSFTGQPTLAGTDLITFVRSGTNFNVSFTNFIASLGVTGTLEPIGDPLGTPVLNQPSAGVNEIRNIEGSKGIITSISPEDGVNIANDFIQGAAGVPIIQDLNAAQYLLRSLVAGTGINVAIAGDAIQISAVAAIASTKTVIISVESDFPTPSAGVITLEPDTQYLLVQDITTSDRFVMQELTTCAGTESLNITFAYTGTGDMFTGVNVANRISQLTIDCPNGRILNWSTNVFKIFRMNDVTIKSCDKIALMNSVGGFAVCRFTNVSPAEVTTDGIELTGDWNSFLHEISAATISGGAYFNLGTATFNSIIIDLPLANLGAGVNLISGLTGSANINAGGLGLVTRALTSGAGTPLDGVSVNDALWNFDNNDDIPDTRPDGFLSFQTPTTTVLSAATPALITGTWAVERTSQMTGTAAGRITYNGGKNATLPISATLSIEPVSGTNKGVNIYLAKNGSVIANSAVATVVSSGSPKNQTVNWQDSFATGDFYEVFIESIDGTNLEVNTASLRVN